jgi:hypothetical protein
MERRHVVPHREFAPGKGEEMAAADDGEDKPDSPQRRSALAEETV